MFSYIFQLDDGHMKNAVHTMDGLPLVPFPFKYFGYLLLRLMAAQKGRGERAKAFSPFLKLGVLSAVTHL